MVLQELWDIIYYFTLLAEEIHLDFYAEYCNTKTRRHLNSTRKKPSVSTFTDIKQTLFPSRTHWGLCYKCAKAEVILFTKAVLTLDIRRHSFQLVIILPNYPFSPNILMLNITCRVICFLPLQTDGLAGCNNKARVGKIHYFANIKNKFWQLLKNNWHNFHQTFSARQSSRCYWNSHSKFIHFLT